MNRYIYRLLCALAIFFAPSLFSGEMQVFLQEDGEHPETVWALVELRLEKGEYSYWLNPGEGGYPSSLEWSLPEGYIVESLEWESPKPFQKLGQRSFGYSEKMRALAKIQRGASSGEKGKVFLSYLICNDEACFPKEAEANFFLDQSGQTQKMQRRVQEKLELFQKHLPLENQDLHAKVDGASISLELPLKRFPDEAWVLPYEKGIVDLKQAAKIRNNEEKLFISAPLIQNIEALEGVLLLKEKGKYKAWKINPQSYLQEAENPEAPSIGFLLTLCLAFLGGVLLNIMPCVLPVLSLKILSFVELSKKEKKAVLRYGFLFTLGVLVSFWILGGLLLILRAYGANIGWGFQLQHPVFVVTMLILFYLMGLSLFGVFEWGTSFARLGKYEKLSKDGGVFLSGMFATLVATPCTGPLLGPALGLALTLDSPTSLGMLSMVGLGLAAPYLIFSMFPKLLRFFPKPGPWLVSFRQLMGFFMMASVAWFLWVLQDQLSSSDKLLQIFLSLLAIALGAWIYGKSQFRKSGAFRKALAALLILCGIYFMFDGVRGGSKEESTWKPYHKTLLQEAVSRGQPVFVDFNAKWCLICQANKVVLESEAIQEAFKKYDVLALRADWTKKDPEITKALATFGRSGVPLYVLYQEGKEPHIFSQVLSQSSIINALKDEYAD